MVLPDFSLDLMEALPEFFETLRQAVQVFLHGPEQRVDVVVELQPAKALSKSLIKPLTKSRTEFSSSSSAGGVASLA